MTRFLATLFLLAALSSVGCESSGEFDVQANAQSGSSDPVDAEEFFSKMPDQLRGVSSPGKPKSVT